MAQANEERFQVRSFPTPLPVDLIFYQRHDANLPKNKKFTYGSPHPDKIQFPNHVLALVTPDDQEGFQKWYYVAKRQDQDLYNWEFLDADIKGNKFRLVTRTYITLRSEYTVETPLMGEEMPNIPVGKFDLGNVSPTLTDYVLAERKQVTAQEPELNNLFVMEVRVYADRATISNVQLDIQTGNSKRSTTNLYYRGELVSGTPVEDLAADPDDSYWGLQADGTFRELEQISDNWFAITESTAVATGGGPLGPGNPAKTRVITRPTPIVGDIIFFETGILPDPVPAYGTAHYDSANWPDHKLALIRPADKTGLLYEFVYVADRTSQDNYNWEFAQADIGGTKFNAITRTYVTRRSSFNPASPAQGATMATALSGAPGTYILAERKQTRTNDQEIDNLYVIDVHTYVVRATIADINTDRTLGVGVQRKTTLYYRGESLGGTTVQDLFDDPTDSFWGIQTSGIERAGQQLTDNWFAVIETSSRDAALLAYEQTFPTSVNLDLPDVLTAVSVVWNIAEAAGNYESDWVGESAWTPAYLASTSISGSEGAKADGSASVQPEINVEITSPNGRGVPATAKFFYMKLVGGVLSESALLSRCGAGARWPRFNPVAHTIIAKGQKVGVSAQANASASVSGHGNSDTGEGSASHEKNEGSGTSFDVSTVNNTVRIPPTIHDTIDITEDTETAEASANCDVGWVGGGTGESIAGISLDFPSVSASASASMIANGAVTPITLPATVPKEIPESGIYLVESRIQPFEPGWVQCYTETIDASDILQ